MKRIGFIILTLLLFQFGFSQTEKLLMGKVIDKDSSIQGADVVNYTTKKSTVTNKEGTFYIKAKSNDILLFYHKKHYEKKMILSQKDINSENISIELVIKSIELNEVIIQKNQSNEFKITEADIDEQKFLNEYERPKVLGSYDGSTPGVDLLGLGIGSVVGTVKVVKKIFNLDKEVMKEKEIVFKEYVVANFKDDYFVKELKLKPNEIKHFIVFCTIDPKSKIILENLNILEVMDFLNEKSVQFKKLSYNSHETFIK